ncbi:hypothetical protein Plhal304r1_c052g0136301 [Plasmopara halstedii]
MATPFSRSFESGTKRKRKRSSHVNAPNDSASLLSVEKQLQTLEKWYRVLTIDLSELRSECARVRMEIEKIDDTVEAAVENSELCVAQAQAAQELAFAATKAKEEAAESTESKIHAVNAKLDRVSKKCITLDKQIAECTQSNITEDFIMTQLSELQEQYENELAKVRKDHDAAQKAQQKQLERVLVRLKENKTLKRQMGTMERMIQSLSGENKFLIDKINQLDTLQQQIERIERGNQDERGCTQLDNQFKDKLVEFERRVANAERMLGLDRKKDNLCSTKKRATSDNTMLILPTSSPQASMRPENLSGIYEQLRLINCDIQTFKADFYSLAKQRDVRESPTKNIFESRLQELSTQLFGALGHDSRLHANEISRLKDAIFDVRSYHRDLEQRMKRLEDDVQQKARRDRPNYSPPSPNTYWNRQRRTSHHKSAPDYTWSEFDRSAQDRARWTSGRNVHDRFYEARNTELSRFEPINARSGRHNQSSNEPFYSPSYLSSAAPVRRNVSNSTRLLPASMGQYHDACDNNDYEKSKRSEQLEVPFRRIRQLPKSHEVIVIEEDDGDVDDDEDSGMRNVNEFGDDGDNQYDHEADVGEDAARAPPDIVLDEEDMNLPSNVNAADTPETCSTENNHSEITDLLENEADLKMGLLLYFCLGGAPDLDNAWTSYFTQLKSDECVEIPRVIQFQRRYSILHSFPVHLTQCILQAVILNRQNVRVGINPKALRLSEPLSAASLRAISRTVVQNTHLSWAKALVDFLLKQVSDLDEPTLEKPELSVNPAGVASLPNEFDAIYAWSRRQENTMWILAQKLHYKSVMPAMKFNANESPAVYLFLVMFDVLTVTSECPQYGSFRLNSFGKKTFAYLWNHTLKRLPYIFFADWSWLEDQTTKKKLPALAFCHLLVTIMLWNSAIDRHSLTNLSIYATAVKSILTKLYLGGRAVLELLETTETTFLALGEDESTYIELRDLDSTFASTLGLDGFFEVSEVIQNNMLAVAALEPRANLIRHMQKYFMQG